MKNITTKLAEFAVFCAVMLVLGWFGAVAAVFVTGP